METPHFQFSVGDTSTNQEFSAAQSQLPDIINAIPLAEVYSIIIHQADSDFQEVPFPNHVW